MFNLSWLANPASQCTNLNNYLLLTHTIYITLHIINFLNLNVLKIERVIEKIFIFDLMVEIWVLIIGL